MDRDRPHVRFLLGVYLYDAGGCRQDHLGAEGDKKGGGYL